MKSNSSKKDPQNPDNLSIPEMRHQLKAKLVDTLIKSKMIQT
jgi:hypothetical protein